MVHASTERPLHHNETVTIPRMVTAHHKKGCRTLEVSPKEAANHFDSTKGLCTHSEVADVYCTHSGSLTVIVHTVRSQTITVLIVRLQMVVALLVRFTDLTLSLHESEECSS